MDVDSLEWEEHFQSMMHARAYHRTIVGGANIIHLGGDHSNPELPVNTEDTDEDPVSGSYFDKNLT